MVNLMIGITSYATSIPRHRLARETIAKAWGVRSAPGAKAVINFDEDSLTMGQAAVWPLLQSGISPDLLYFASTTSPYWQRSASSLIAAFCDLPPEVTTTDFGGSPRAGTSALRSAFDAVEAGRSNAAVVAATDAREGAPESGEEMIFGDGAAAVAVGQQRVVAELIGCASRNDDFLDEWRRDADRYVGSFTSKFSIERGYVANAVALGKALLQQAGLQPGDIARAALASPDGRAHLSVAKSLGIAAERVEDSGDPGVTGTAMPLLLLAQSLDQATAGDVIMLIGYGEGADGFLFRVTSEIERLPRPLLKSNQPTIEYPSYQIYRKRRDYLLAERGGAEISNVLWEREETQNVRLRGTFCPRCETLQYPMTRVCAKCRNREELSERGLARTGRIFTFTKDYLYASPAPPTINVVVDLDGGGRFLCQMTDANEQQVEIGMRVELVVRRMKESDTMHHYYWKCRTVD